MHNVNVEAVERTAATAMRIRARLCSTSSSTASGRPQPGRPQFRAIIPVPNGEPVVFEADFPPPMGGAGAAPNPLAYCFWGGLACYAMTYAQEAARRGVELRSLRARVEVDVDQSRALGVTDNAPGRAHRLVPGRRRRRASAKLAELKRAADEHCPGAYCIRNPIDLRTHVHAA